MTDDGLSPIERRRKRRRTLSRLFMLAVVLPPHRRPLWRGWFYAQQRGMGHTRREAWADAGFDIGLSRALRSAGVVRTSS